MAPHVTRRSGGKLGGRDERRETFVEYIVLPVAYRRIRNGFLVF